MIYSPIGQGLEEVKKMIEESDQNPLPILHNKDCIILQYSGWSLNLLSNGQWGWESTEGG